jgi:hypothetical protein
LKLADPAATTLNVELGVNEAEVTVGTPQVSVTEPNDPVPMPVTATTTLDPAITLACVTVYVTTPEASVLETVEVPLTPETSAALTPDHVGVIVIGSSAIAVPPESLTVYLIAIEPVVIGTL